jgi:hydrogenase maturation protein HypF
LVQGVGFRPFVYRIACEEGVSGEVVNYTAGVVIRAVFPSEDACRRFIGRLRAECPDVASIHIIEVDDTAGEWNYAGFTISPSREGGGEVTQVSPDIAVCRECMDDRTRQPLRLGYPFINCTNCGPRFSIMRDLPYDREQTTMSVFDMCPDCRREYEEATDRRFHAQPVACNHCGPSYYALYDDRVAGAYDELLDLSAGLLEAGEVIAAKGVGGYHLVCDALQERAVNRLRLIKGRDSRPFAIMFRSMEALGEYAAVSEEEAALIGSWRRPIVIVEQRAGLAHGVNPGMHTLGVMLPYMPLHYDWFSRLKTPALVMTSGNRGEMPIAISEADAAEQFGRDVPLVMHHNRAIHNRVDDSVVQFCGPLPCLIRRSRGYAPEPLPAGDRVEGVLAFGAEQSNTFAIGKGDVILQSQHIGDLKNWETLTFYTGAMESFGRLFRFTARRLACDMHPGYLSSLEAARMSSALGLPLLRVQHHHAHAVACMVEYGLHRPVVAVVMDGAGMGDDGHTWGGEFLLCDRKSYRRLSHFEYLPLPGGDKAALEPWRMATACLHAWGLPFPAGFAGRVGEDRITRLRRMIDLGIRTPQTSAAGRLFDAVASLLDLCDVASHQGEAPVLLEQSASGWITAPPPAYRLDADAEVVSFRPVMEGILQDMAEGAPAGYVSARFHATMAHLFAGKARRLVEQTGASGVCVSGGCFQNRFITVMLQGLFASQSVPLYIPSRVPCNDAGISVGQCAAAATATGGL